VLTITCITVTCVPLLVMHAKQGSTSSDTAVQSTTTSTTTAATSAVAAAVQDSVLADLRLSGLRCNSAEQCTGVMVRSQLLVQSVCTSCNSSESMAVAEARHTAACTALTDSIAAARTSLHAAQAQSSTTTAAAAAAADALQSTLQQLQSAIALAKHSLHRYHSLLLHADSVAIDVCELFLTLSAATATSWDSDCGSIAYVYRSSVVANIGRIEALTQLPSPQLAQLYTQLAKAIAAMAAADSSNTNSSGNSNSSSDSVQQQGHTRQQCLQRAKHMYTVCCSATDDPIKQLDALV
jgi:hypothetical protein